MDCTAPTPGEAGYRYGCHCATCRAGHATKQSEYRAARAERARIAAPVMTPEQAANERAIAAIVETPDPGQDPLSLDPDIEAGPIQTAFAGDLAGLVGDVAWKDTLAAMVEANARIVDQVARHQRLEVLAGVQLRMLGMLDRMRVAPTVLGSPVPDSVPAEWSAAGLADPD